MANTMTLISSSTVGSGGASSVSFSSIPNTYTDLCIMFSTRCTNASNFTAIGLTINGNESSGAWRLLYGNNGSAYSGYNTGYTDTAFSSSANTTANTFANNSIYITDYLNSNYKSFSTDFATENNSTATDATVIGIRANLWANTSAITSLSFLSRAGNFAQYSTFYLYGIKNS